MKKPYKHTVLSTDRFCVNPACRKPLKMNVIARKPTADHCYECGQAKRKKHGKGKPKGR